MDHAVAEGHALVEQAEHERGRSRRVPSESIQSLRQCALIFFAANISGQLLAAPEGMSCSLGNLQQVHRLDLSALEQLGETVASSSRMRTIRQMPMA